MKPKILGLLAVGLLVGPMTAHAVGVVVGGKEWRQLTDTVNLSWNQVASVCNTTTGVCSGSLGAVSFDGWTWASRIDIQALFEELILPGTVQFPTLLSFYQVVPAGADIDAAIDVANAFAPTTVTSLYEEVRGWSRDTNGSDPSTAYAPYMINTFPATGWSDVAYIGSVSPKFASNSSQGVWLYRSVPNPPRWHCSDSACSV